MCLEGARITTEPKDMMEFGSPMFLYILGIYGMTLISIGSGRQNLSCVALHIYIICVA